MIGKKLHAFSIVTRRDEKSPIHFWYSRTFEVKDRLSRVFHPPLYSHRVCFGDYR